MRNIAVLGSTGSIGTQTLDVIEAFPELYRASVLACAKSWQKLCDEARKFRPDAVVIGDEAFYDDVKSELDGTGIRVLAGKDGLIEAASLDSNDVVLTAVVGVSGLEPTAAALKAGKPIALANKETLVVGGSVITKLAKAKGLPLLPVDSEHSAIFQCLHGQPEKSLQRILLTASGGPFRQKPREELAGMTASAALKHPTWNMGAKITIDSASLMNKGFEVLEAVHLFGVTLDQIEVWVHPQSIVHSMVEFIDGSVLAQVGPPDMRTPIQYALSWPGRLPKAWEHLTLKDCAQLTFEEPRWDDFPCLRYAFEAGRLGGTMPCVVNAANEIAVAAFLHDEIFFGDIPKIIRTCMDGHMNSIIADPTLEDLGKIDKETRGIAAELVKMLE